MNPHLVGFGEIGAYLRETRESLGVDASQAARALHLKPGYLAALEHGRMDDLPGFTYARGYLSTYAEYLGLDRAMLLRAFEEAGSFRPQSIYHPEPTRRDARPGWGLLLGVVMLLAIIATWRSLFSPSEGPLPVAGVPEEAVSIAAPARIAHAEPLAMNRPCLLVMPIGPAPTFCRWQPFPAQSLGMRPKMRYSSELQFPTYLILPPQ